MICPLYIYIFFFFFLGGGGGVVVGGLRVGHQILASALFFIPCHRKYNQSEYTVGKLLYYSTVLHPTLKLPIMCFDLIPAGNLVSSTICRHLQFILSVV